QYAYEFLGQKILLVDNLVELKQLGLIETRPLDDLDHLGDYSAGQVAGCSQFQPTRFNCPLEQNPGSAGDRRSRKIGLGKDGFKPDRLIVCRGFAMQGVEALQI